VCPVVAACPSPEAFADSEYVDFSPTDEFNHVIDHIKAQG
jgi:hypothetical protein